MSVKSNINARIDSVGLSIRAVNALERHGVQTVRQLAALERRPDRGIKNFGPGCQVEVDRVLELFGIVPAWDLRSARQLAIHRACIQRESALMAEVRRLRDALTIIAAEGRPESTE